MAQDQGVNRKQVSASPGGVGEEVNVSKVEFNPLPDPVAAPLRREISPAFLGVEMQLAAELGKTSIKIRDLIDMEEGSLLKLNRLADESVLLMVNEVPFAQGEIVVINERFGVRITAFIHEQRE
ncbi:MAG: flagellar motor switch protein FliN [Firmicutes bacterium]|nr:flagellar motor switch protein FliN [Bacillota bacterium]